MNLYLAWLKISAEMDWFWLELICN